MIRRISRALFLVLTLAALMGCGDKKKDTDWKGGFGNGFRRNIAIVFFMAAGASLLLDDRRIMVLIRKN